MEEKINAPFTDKQVKALNEYQKLGFMHEFIYKNLIQKSGSNIFTIHKQAMMK